MFDERPSVAGMNVQDRHSGTGADASETRHVVHLPAVQVHLLSTGWRSPVKALKRTQERWQPEWCSLRTRERHSLFFVTAVFADELPHIAKVGTTEMMVQVR